MAEELWEESEEAKAAASFIRLSQQFFKEKEERMAFKFGQKGGKKKASNIVRLTSLFPLKGGKVGT